MRMVNNRGLVAAIGLLSVATLALCVWIAAAVNAGAAVIGLLGIGAGAWLLVMASGGSDGGGRGTPQPIPVYLRRNRR